VNALHTLAVERAGLPRVTIAQRVIDKMVRNALIYETETGEALIGLPVPSAGRYEPDLVVLETITPDHTAVRKYAYFEQGDDLQGDIMNWLTDNWNDYRKLPSAKVQPRYNVALDHLGDWHKHPGALTEPSWGDLETALAHVNDKEAGKPYLLAILATVWDRVQAHATDEAEAIYFGEQPIKVDIDENTTVRLDCWYMSRRTKRFVHLTPTVEPDDKLPNLPLVSWHLGNTERFQQEFKQITGAGYTVSVDEYNADDVPPRELCLTLAKRGASHIQIVVTTADFPNTRPTIRTVPMGELKTIPEGADVFLELWKRAKLLPEAEYPNSWTANSTILDLVRGVEQNLKE
jgi:hypothetical protein